MLFFCLYVHVFAQASESGSPLEDVLAPKPGLAAAKMDSSAPSVILLPPRFRGPPKPQVQAAAELACDRLAQEIAAAGLARVVDRQQLDRALQEYSIAAKSSASMLSYDVMIRMEVNDSPLSPETHLSVIELSTGNALKEQAFGWPLKEANVAPILAFCRQTLKFVTKPSAKKLRVRTLWAAEATPNERIRPLAQRLIEVFEESLKRSDRVMLVQHLEAATAKEESLLLLMGMSRLPGGRQFTPQADATIELRVGEGNGQGKTFSETPIEIGVRLRKGANYQGDWVVTAGLVRDFDAMIPQAWQKLAQSLGEVRPETVTALLTEMSLRRKQTEAELQTVRELRKSQPSDANDGARILMVALSHAETAIKLDPTCTEAIRVYVELLANLSDCDYQKRMMPEAPLRTLQEALHYMERFRQDSELCGVLCACANHGVGRSPMETFWRPRRYDDPLPPFTNDMLTMTPELLKALNAAKRLLDRGVEDDVKFRFDATEWMLVPIFRGMRLVHVPTAERQAWLKTIAIRCLEKVKRGRARAIDPIWDWQHCIHLQVRIAELLIEDGQMDSAKQVLAQAQNNLPEEYASTAYSIINLMRAVVLKANDTQLLADLNAWIKRGEKTKVHLIYIEWPTVDLFTGRKTPDCICVGSDRSPLKMPMIYYDRHGNYRPLGDGDGRLYFYTMDPPCIAYIPLDAHGQPIGKSVRNPRPFGMNIWDNIKEIPQPKWNASSCEVTSARYIDGKLYVGTRGFGLQVFDPKTEHWKSYGPEQGLPSRDVEEFFPIGGQMLYCNTKRTHYMLNLINDAVTLVHRTDLQTWEEDWSVGWNLQLAWRDDERVIAVDGAGVWDNLLSKARKWTPLPNPTCYGWPMGNDSRTGLLGVVESNGRRFCVCRGGLYELDTAGKVKVLRVWETTHYCPNPMTWHVVAPADCPITDWTNVVCATGAHIVFTDHRYMIVYDINSDTWYGPLNVGLGNRPLTPLATSQGMLWGTWPTGLTCLALDEVIPYAKSIGRAMTTTEYRQRRQQFIDVAKPLDCAKFNLGMRRFDKAKAALQQVIDAEPNQAEALLLMGFLHVRDCLNQPDEAIKYYRRAAEIENNPVASCSGMFFLACVLADRQQWKETLDMCEKILMRYPGLEQGDRQRIQWLQDSSRQQLSKKTVKQPSAGASNKEDTQKN